MEVNFVNKRKIVYNHIKNIKRARKIKEIHCNSCIFNMSSNDLAYILGIKENDVLAPCPLAAYVLFIYGFINSCTYDHALGNLAQKHPISNKITDQNFDSLNEKQKNYIISYLQTKYVDCGIGCKQECHITEVNKI